MAPEWWSWNRVASELRTRNGFARHGGQAEQEFWPGRLPLPHPSGYVIHVASRPRGSVREQAATRRR